MFDCVSSMIRTKKTQDIWKGSSLPISSLALIFLRILSVIWSAIHAFETSNAS